MNYFVSLPWASLDSGSHTHTYIDVEESIYKKHFKWFHQSAHSMKGRNSTNIY